jgi:hypothetical protein
VYPPGAEGGVHEQQREQQQDSGHQQASEEQEDEDGVQGFEQEQHSAGEVAGAHPGGSPDASAGAGGAEGSEGGEGEQQDPQMYSSGDDHGEAPPQGALLLHEDLPSSSNADQSTGGVPDPRGSTSRAAQQSLGHSSQGTTRPQGRAAGLGSSPWQAAASQPPPAPPSSEPQPSPSTVVEVVDLT